MHKSLLLLVTILALFFNAYSQINLAKQWDHTYGGNYRDVLKSFLHTTDNGFLLGGTTQSDSGYDVSQASRGGMDMWVVKTDSMGEKIWDVRFGGSDEDRLFSADETTDGGYILGGFTRSDSGGDVSQPSKGSLDFWLIKIDSSGAKIWDKRYGGLDYEQLSSVQQTLDGGYLLGGWTFSDSTGDVSQPTRGGEDFWVIKVDQSGNIQWDKRFGGNSNDVLFYLEQTTDGGYILGGRTSSDSIGDVSQNPRGDNDYWIVKINSAGNKLWDKRFGGMGRDNFIALQQTNDGGYVLGGYTTSDQDGDVSEISRDTGTIIIQNRGDIWIVKTDSLGVKQWDRRFGGLWREDAFGHVKQTLDGGYLWGCAAYSGAGGDKTENNFGYEQTWVVKIDSAGNKLWDKTLFVSGEDEYGYPIELDNGCYVIANWSFGDSAGYKTEFSRGDWDYWMIKFCETAQPQLPQANFYVSNPFTCAGGCFSFDNTSYNAGTFQWYFPGGSPSSSTITSPESICYPDTGNYSVTLIAISPGGNDTITLSNIFNIYPLPIVEIAQSGDTLSVNPGFADYTWYVNGSVLPNDTIHFLVATQNGEYIVSVIDSNGCPKNDTIPSFNVGVSDFSAKGYEINVYPNPAQNELNVKGLETSGEGELNIYDIAGRKVYITSLTATDLKIQISDFKPGIYILNVNSEHQKMFLRFVKD